MKNGSGWKGESHRHRLAGMGIKTSKSKVIKISQEMKLDIKEDIKTIKNNIEGMSPDNIISFETLFDKNGRFSWDDITNYIETSNILSENTKEEIFKEEYKKRWGLDLNTFIYNLDEMSYFESSGQFLKFDELESHIQRKVLRYDTLENIRRDNPFYTEDGTEIY